MRKRSDHAPLSFEWSQTGRGARIHLRSRSPDPLDPRGSARHPIAVRFEDISARLLKSAEFRFSASLRPGARRIPLREGFALRIRVPEGCEACGVAEVREWTAPGTPAMVLETLRIEFTRPLVLSNVLQALLFIQREVQDLAASEFLESWPLWREFLRERAGGFPAAWKGLPQDPISVSLSGIIARAEWEPSRGQVELRAAFSGHVQVAGGLSWPFSGVTLPTALLPSLHADLDRLAVGEWLASGVLRRRPGTTAADLVLLRALWGFLDRAEADLTASFRPPPVTWEAEAGDRTRLNTSISLQAEAIRIHGHLAIAFQKDLAMLRRSRVTLGSDDPETATQVEMSGPVRLNLADGDIPWKDRLGAQVLVEFQKGSVSPGIEVSMVRTHPWTVGRVQAGLRLVRPEVRGRVRLVLDHGDLAACPIASGLSVRAALVETDPEVLRTPRDRAQVTLRDAHLRADWRASPDGFLATLRTSAEVGVQSEILLAPLPELRIHDPTLRIGASAHLEVHADLRYRRPGNPHRPRAALDAAVGLNARLHEASIHLDGHGLSVPRGTVFEASYDPGDLLHGPIRTEVEVAWRIGEGVLFRSGDRSVVLSNEPIEGRGWTIHMSESGRFAIRAPRGGLAGLRFLGALLGSSSDPQPLLDLLASADAMESAIAILDAFHPGLARAGLGLRDRLRVLRSALAGMKLADFITPDGMARALSVAIARDDRFSERLKPVVRSVLGGRGVPRREVEGILRDAWDLEGHDYEMAGVLRWLDLVLKVGEPLPRAEPIETPPLCATEEDRRNDPSAAEILEATRTRLPAERQAFIVQAAPRMTLDQVEGLVRAGSRCFRADHLRFLKRVREVKRRVRTLETQGYGGLADVAQAARIAAFLGDAIGPLRALGEDPNSRARAALGPREVATLFHAGLSQVRQGTQAQVNNRLLIEFLRESPRDLTREVLIEMGHRVPGALAGVLFAFLHQDQDHLREPIDLCAFLSERLGLPVPRQSEYLAGGRLARDSYFDALYDLAERILADAGPLIARQIHIQEFPAPVPPAPRPSGHAAALAREARAAIAAADRLGRRLDFEAHDEASLRAARRAYETAFEACAAFLCEVPDGFTLQWFREFWSRNEEALKVLSVVRSYLEDHDDVRRWMRVVSGRDAFANEQDLLETVIQVLYAREEDRRVLARDPLQRLLIPAPRGRYRFTVIGCMGVITDGERGRELEDAFRRLNERYGVEVIRAHTGLFRPLEWNAEAVIAAIRKARTRFGLLGYSQGCANALMAEHRLWTGTPEQRRLIEGLVCRNFLFSAANGSVHGSSAERKFRRAIVEGERFLKPYQAVFSNEAVGVWFRALKTMFESPFFLLTLAGAHSLTLERAIALHRDGRFRADVPTSSVRGIVTADRVPEALEYLYHCHSALLPGVPHDSQVAVDEAVAQASRVRNALTEALRRCDMGSMPFAVHHWAPVTVEIEKVTTPRDVERAVYQGPKDVLVFPWVEVNARFGRIERDRV